MNGMGVPTPNVSAFCSINRTMSSKHQAFERRSLLFGQAVQRDTLRAL